MISEVLEAIPKRFIKGTTVTCRLTPGGYLPQEGWALTLALRGAGVANVEATPDGDGFVVTLPQDMAAGRWWWQAFVKNEGTGETQAPLGGELVVEPSLLDAADGYDGRSPARVALNAIDAVIANKATSAQSRYRIKDRELQSYSVAELLRLRAHYVAQVQKENGSGGFRKIRVRF